MKVFRNENIRPFDVDDTLVMHLEYSQLKNIRTVTVEDPLTKEGLLLGVNAPMVRLLEEEVQRGGQIIVWSRGGYQWAENVLKALNLDKYDILVMSKPTIYYDDTDVSNWLKDRVYLEYNKTYKNLSKTK